MLIKERIKNRRNELGMTQTELARKAGLQPPAISQYESGTRSPSFEALRKLSNALNVTTDYLTSGIKASSADNKFLDKKNEVLFKVIASLTADQKDELLRYATFLATGRKSQLEVAYSSASEYAEYTLKQFDEFNQLPIDVFGIANKLGIKVIEADLQEGEGMLIKGEQNIIILDSKKKHKSRKKFTLATLLGHSVIPWHINSTYITRKYIIDNNQNNIAKNIISDELLTGESTLLTEEIQEMEAHTFANSLFIPFDELRNDFAKQEGSIERIKNLADKKYEVSFFVLCNRLVDINNNYAVIQSEDFQILKTYPGKRPLIFEKIDNKSVAASFFESPIEQEEIRKGKVPAKCWFMDAKEGEMVYEESIFNPKYGKVLTLIKSLT